MNRQKKFSTISNKNDLYVLHDLIWLIHFIWTLTSTELGDFYRNGYQAETEQWKVTYLKSQTIWIMQLGKCTKSQMVIYIAEKPNSVDQVDVQKRKMQYKLTVCGTDESQQKGFNNLE